LFSCFPFLSFLSFSFFSPLRSTQYYLF
jgi:hypothetical protein